MVHKRKAWDLYCLLVPHPEALVLPIVVERAKQRPHADMLSMAGNALTLPLLLRHIHKSHLPASSAPDYD